MTCLAGSGEATKGIFPILIAFFRLRLRGSDLEVHDHHGFDKRQRLVLERLMVGVG
jgi:hypothetical protein